MAEPVDVGGVREVLGEAMTAPGSWADEPWMSVR
jgi:hypothetical protein